MIRARATGAKGRPVIILGLSAQNLKRLRKGMPIHVHCDELGFAGELVIFAGETEAELAKMFKPFIGPETVVHDTTEKKRN